MNRSAKVHVGLAGFWVVMIGPAIIWLKDSILFVILMSLYANIESSLAAFQAANDGSSKRKKMRSSELHRQSPYYRRR